MLVAVAVVPGTPALVPQLMGRASHELDGLRRAADSALRGLVTDLVAAVGNSAAAGDPAAAAQPAVQQHAASQILVVGAGPVAEFDAAGPVSFAQFGLGAQVAALAHHDRPACTGLPTPLMVGRYLAGRVADDRPDGARLWAAARWLTTDRDAGRRLGESLGGDDVATGLVVVMDGALCHGPKAPRAEDPRAAGFEDSVCAALAGGDPAALGRLDAGLGTELGSTGPVLWPLLETATAGASWRPELMWRGAPYGVGWAVALWRGPAPLLTTYN